MVPTHSDNHIWGQPEGWGMAADPNTIEQAVSRTLRDNLERIQRSSEELREAVNDLVSACSSSRPGNALPPMIRAQASAASFSAVLDVLARFVTSAMQSASRSSLEQEISRATSLIAEELATTAVQPETAPEHLMEQKPWTPPEPVEQLSPAVVEIPPVAEPVEPVSMAEEIPPVAETVTATEERPSFEAPPLGDLPVAGEPVANEPVPVFVHEQVPELDPFLSPEAYQESESPEAEKLFNLDLLAPEEQELHRRASRVAKVSMQDIKMLRPEDVRVGRENRDLCFRLRDDIEKAHKEYDRRFQSIQSHPVDYFYDWMVEILAGGDSQALGEYPYPSPVLRR
jgi:hypothetical protein